MPEVLFVGLGGAVGAVFRYLLCLVPNKSDFPFMTLSVNLIGAVAIGIITGFAIVKGNISRNTLLFLKTGVCGGFTTFSTFSLESISLFEHSKNLTACVYIASSLICCLIGVKLGVCLGKVLAEH